MGTPPACATAASVGPVGAGVEAGVVAVDVGAGHERPAGHRLGAAQRRGRDRQHLGTGGRVERRAVAGVHVDCGTSPAAAVRSTPAARASQSIAPPSANGRRTADIPVIRRPGRSGGSRRALTGAPFGMHAVSDRHFVPSNALCL